MSWSVVRTCSRCGTRAEVPLYALEDVPTALRMFVAFFSGHDKHDGCPSCSAELGNVLVARGSDLGDWQKAVTRARGPTKN